MYLLTESTFSSRIGIVMAFLILEHDIILEEILKLKGCGLFLKTSVYFSEYINTNVFQTMNYFSCHS